MRRFTLDTAGAGQELQKEFLGANHGLYCSTLLIGKRTIFACPSVVAEFSGRQRGTEFLIELVNELVD